MTCRPHDGIVGRGMTEGASSSASGSTGSTAAAASGEPTAYVFVMGSLAELLRVFDFELSFPEINSLQTAVRRVAHEYLNEAEDYGYSPDICGYVKADVAVQLRNGAHPMGTLPPPALAIADQRVQHLREVGRDLGALLPRAGVHARRAGHAPRRRPDVAGRSRLRRRLRLRRRADSGADRAVRAGERQDASTSIGCARRWRHTNAMTEAW